MKRKAKVDAALVRALELLARAAKVPVGPTETIPKLERKIRKLESFIQCATWEHEQQIRNLENELAHERSWTDSKLASIIYDLFANEYDYGGKRPLTIKIKHEIIAAITERANQGESTPFAQLLAGIDHPRAN